MAGLTGDQLATHLGCSAPRVRQIETGLKIPTRPEIFLLASLAHAEDRLPALLELWEGAHERGWWETQRIPKWMKTYVGLESAASTVRCFALELVPGMLQTRDYAAAVLSLHQAGHDDVESAVAFRMERKAGLGHGQQLQAVMSEALLARAAHMGSAGVGQLDHLASFADADAVTVMVLPFTAGVHRSMTGSFTLLEFGGDAPVAWQSYAVGGHLIDGVPAVEALQKVYEELAGQSLDRRASAERIKQYALEGCGG